MFRFERTRSYLATRDLRIGILFNIIPDISSKEKIDRIPEDWILDHVKEVQKAIDNI